jgi:hypothetical protein
VRNAAGQVFALTASHCTGNYTGGAIGQTWNQATTSAWATIAINPAWATSGCSAGATRCINADVAALQYNSGVSGTFGMVQTSSVGGNFGPGNLTIASTLYATTPNPPAVGDTAYKTGRTTGTTKGPVVATCSDIIFDGGLEVRCLTTAKYWADGGDSGGPAYNRWHPPCSLTRGVRLGYMRVAITRQTLWRCHWATSIRGQESKRNLGWEAYGSNRGFDEVRRASPRKEVVSVCQSSCRIVPSCRLRRSRQHGY